MEVREVLHRLSVLGLEIKQARRTGHYKVYDPVTGAWLFDVSGSPGDANWHYNIARNLRRIGLSLDAEKIGKGYKSRKAHPAVDLEALQKAQEAARAAGEREPQLSDLDDAPPTSPLWKRTKQSGSRPLTDAAQKEVIENMALRAEDTKLRHLRARLENFFMEKSSELEARARQRSPKLGKGKGAKAEFVRIAIEEVGPQRNLRAWKSVDSGQQTLSYFMKNESSGMSNWTRKIIEATMDHVDGLKWGTVNGGEAVEEAAVTIAPDPPSQAEIKAEIDADEVMAEADDRAEKEPDSGERYRSAVRESSYKDRYIEVLLKMLENGKHSDEVVAMEIMPRLDKLLIGGE
jgi:hypothetical protein